MNADEQTPDFGEYGDFLEDSVKYILEHKPASIGIVGILPDGQTIGAYYKSSIADKIQMAGNIALDIVMDTIEANAGVIREILENAPTDEAYPDGEMMADG